MNNATVARIAAILIAVAGVIDPAFATRRSTRPEIALVDAATGDRALVERVHTELSKRFDVVAGTWPGAAAMVIAGSRVPEAANGWTGPAFVVAPAAADLGIVSATAPSRAQVDAKVPVTIALTTKGLAGRRIETSVAHEGRVVDSTTTEVKADAATQDLTLSFVPTREGAARLEVTARVVDGQQVSTTPLLVDVSNRKWRVLFVDARPSWSSTFVRRALERDGRFDVASRVATSRSVTASTADAPARLDDLADLGRFDAAVVSASAELAETDVRHLESFARARGGTLVVLLEARPAGAIDSLIGVHGWQSKTTTEPASLTPASQGHPSLGAAEFAWPTGAPAVSTPIATFTPSKDAGPVPVVWQAPLGDGAMIVSAAFDAWRWRAAEGSTFDAFWRQTIGNAAARAPVPIEVEIDTPVLRPGEVTTIRVSARDIAIAANEPGRARATASAAMTAPDGSTEAIVLVPTAPGQFLGRWRATSVDGVHRLTATVNDVRGGAVAAVAANATRRPMPAERLSAWAAAHKGRVFNDNELEPLSAALVEQLAPAREDIRWHPMRSAWWIIPFAGLLGFEWMARRKRSLV